MCFAELPDPTTTVTDSYPLGNFVLVVYIGQVEAEQPKEETAQFTLIKYMDRKAHNKFVWGFHEDIYKMKNSDILLKVDLHILIVSNRI